MMSSCIIAAQLVMFPIAAFGRTQGDQWGSKPVLLIGFVILPMGSPLYAVGRHPWLIAINCWMG